MNSRPAFVPVVPSSLSLPASTRASTFTPAAPAPFRPPRARCTPRRAIIAASKPLDIDGDEFEEIVLGADVPVLVDFYAPWCGPCKLVAPLMDWAASEFDGKLKVVKVDTDKDDRFVDKYKIHGLPTFAVFKNGEAFGVKEGAMGKALLEEYILRYAPEVA